MLIYFKETKESVFKSPHQNNGWEVSWLNEKLMYRMRFFQNAIKI